MDIKFKKVTQPTGEINEYLHKWQTDPLLIPLIHRNENKTGLEMRATITIKNLEKRLASLSTFGKSRFPFAVLKNQEAFEFQEA